MLAVPGNVLSGRNRGGHALLRDGAKIVESADDILEELGLAPAVAPSRRDAGRRSRRHDPVLACLPPGEACDLDAIAERSGLTPARCCRGCSSWNCRAGARGVGGGRFVRIDRTC